jgi:hypothetical protein
MFDSAAVRFEALDHERPQPPTLGYLGIAYAARGDQAGARRVADSLAVFKSPWLFGANTFWRAAVLAAAGERAGAVELLRQANREGTTMEGWHYHPALASLRGYSAFESLLKPQR